MKLIPKNLLQVQPMQPELAAHIAVPQDVNPWYTIYGQIVELPFGAHVGGEYLQPQDFVVTNKARVAETLPDGTILVRPEHVLGFWEARGGSINFRVAGSRVLLKTGYYVDAAGEVGERLGEMSSLFDEVILGQSCVLSQLGGGLTFEERQTLAPAIGHPAWITYDTLEGEAVDRQAWLRKFARRGVAPPTVVPTFPGSAAEQDIIWFRDGPYIATALRWVKAVSYA